MPNADTAKVKKNMQKKKYSWIIYILKKSIRITTITKQILNLKLSFTIGKLLASTLAMKKQLTENIFKDEAI